MSFWRSCRGKKFDLQPLLTPSELSQLLRGSENVRVLDGSWFLPADKREPQKDFIQARIEGARFFDIDECREKDSPYDHMLPSPEKFSEYVENLGISNESHAVIYDNHEVLGVLSSPRVWWIFRVFGHEKVSISDGGFPKWRAEGKPVVSGELDKESVEGKPSYRAKLNHDMLMDYDFIMNNIKSDPRVPVLDARPPGRFTGEEPEPRSDVPRGHMPHSQSFPYAMCLDLENKIFKTKEGLEKAFKNARVDLQKPLVTSCGTGVSGSGLVFAAFLCGKTDTKLYDGSWTEFALRNPDMTVLGK